MVAPEETQREQGRHHLPRTVAWLVAMVALVHLAQDAMLQNIYFWHLAPATSLLAAVDNRVSSNFRLLFAGILEAQVEVAAVLELAAPASLEM